MGENRLLWIDYAKVIGIFCVILGHIQLDNYALRIWIYSFHMPLFFYISGYTEKANKPLCEILKNAVKRLLIPYICFYLISYAWWLLISFINIPKESLTLDFLFIKPFVGLLLGEAEHTPYSYMINMFLWFLMALFFCKIIFCSVIKLTERMKWNKIYTIIILNILCVAFVYLLNIFQINLYFSIDSALMAIPFYSLAFLMKHDVKSHKKNLLIAFIGVIIGSVLAYLNNRVDISSILWGNNIFIFYINGTIGSIGIIYFTMLFNSSKSRIALYIGQNTLTIFAMQVVTLSVMRSVYGKIIHTPIDISYNFGVLEALLFTTATLIISLPIIYVINRFFPFIMGKVSK